jgi:tRNA pseudouridine32 synthase / 23S rRNA pseudouridine746 synthase
MVHSPFQPFKKDVSSIPLPEAFTFPFYYEPHPLSLLAAAELQNYLEFQSDFNHNFGLNEHQPGLVIGKMFGVLVCKNESGQLGYLWAFSGKLAESNQHAHFVPPVFDMLKTDGFFKKEEEVLNQLNRNIVELEQAEEYQQSLAGQKQIIIDADVDLERQKLRIKSLKTERDAKRSKITETLQEDELEAFENILSEESKKESILLKKMTKYWNYKKAEALVKVQKFEKHINKLKTDRKQKSAELQQKLFYHYVFLNQYGKEKSIGEIFNNNPPAGAGECAAPKLLHFAFKNGLKPIAMAEFWWGQSPASEVRKHKQFYPACKSKCEPILMNHMLDGLEMETNPFEQDFDAVKNPEIVYEDEVMLAINKPSEFLSVPGKTISDSVYSRIKTLYPNATGPLIVHRLDMSTSGIMLIAKNEETYVKLQKQFISRKIQKRYVAVLDGILKEASGLIDLPLRVDLDDRPRQLVCYEYGKPAQTRWEVIQVKNKQTRVYFYPITGRTHQLRVHAAHQSGLQLPIVGDDIYGKKDSRLHLHAESITFTHPLSGESQTITVPAEF